MYLQEYIKAAILSAWLKVLYFGLLCTNSRRVFMSNKGNNETVKWIVIGLIAVTLTSYISFLFVRSKLRTLASTGYQECVSNCERIGLALEMYGRKNDGRYPSTLSALKPDYLSSIPTCSSAKKDTYTQTYQVSPDFETFTFFCGGHYHAAIADPDFPMYNSNFGLVSREFYVKTDPIYMLLYAIKEKRYESVKNILEKNPTLSSRKNEFAATGLHQAAECGKLEAARLLISMGADVNAKNDSGLTPLHLSVLNNNKDMVILLISKGANVNSMDKQSYTPLYYAVDKGYGVITEQLKKSGAKF